MGPLVVVVLDPVRQSFPRFLERLEPRPSQELLLQRLPEPLDLPQRHGMMGRTADVMDVILLQFLLELRRAPPTGVLPPVVGQHLLRRPVLRRRAAIEIDHIGAGLTAIQPQTDHVTGMIVDEPDDVSRLPQDGKNRDVALPHLIRRGPLESSDRRLRLLSRLLLRRPQPCGFQMPPHRLGTRLQEEEPPQNLRDPLHPLPRILSLQRRNLLPDRLGRLRSRPHHGLLPQPSLTPNLVAPRPLVHRTVRNPKLPRHQFARDPFLPV